MILHLSGDVTYEMLSTLAKSLNELKENDKLAIYFTSEGGYTDVSEAIIDLINKNKEYIGITFYGEIFSAGMEIFLRTECPKFILKGTRGMYHFSYQELTISEGGQPSGDYDNFCYKEMKNCKAITLEYLKSTPLNEKEISKIKRGKDVYFPYDRLLQILDATREPISRHSSN